MWWLCGAIGKVPRHGDWCVPANVLIRTLLTLPAVIGIEGLAFNGVQHVSNPGHQAHAVRLRPRDEYLLQYRLFGIHQDVVAHQDGVTVVAAEPELVSGVAVDQSIKLI